MMLAKNLEELYEIKEECQSMVTGRSALSAGAAVIPLPGVDIGADVAIMMELLPAINRKFGLAPDQIDGLDARTKEKLLVIITSIGSELVGKVISKQVVTMLLKKSATKVATKSVAKFIPIIGQIASASISFGAMKYLGNQHIEDCFQICLAMLEE